MGRCYERDYFQPFLYKLITFWSFKKFGGSYIPHKMVGGAYKTQICGLNLNWEIVQYISKSLKGAIHIGEKKSWMDKRTKQKRSRCLIAIKK